MVLNKMKNIKGQSGFTIVELLIVIVVIGSLAAITIVAYRGITNRAKVTKAQANAESVQKVAETINADTGAYPANIAAITAGSLSTKLPSGITLSSGTAPADENGINYVAKGTTGGCITYWNATSSNVDYTKAVLVGNAVGPATLTTCP